MKSKLTIAALLLFTGSAIGQTGVTYKSNLSERLMFYGTSTSSRGYIGIQSSHLRFATGSGINMYFHAGVGLGTTAPLVLSSTGAVITGTLEVTGALTQTGAVTFTGLVTANAGIFVDDSIKVSDGDFVGLGTGKARLVFDDDTNDEIGIMNARVGIGTLAPAHALEIVGNIALGDSTTGDVNAIIYFQDDASVTAESFAWDDGNDQFELSDDFAPTGHVLGAGTGITTDNTLADTLLVTGQVSASTGFTDGTFIADGSGNFSGVGTLAAGGAITASGGIAQPTMTPVVWATGGSVVLATAGNDVTPSDGARWWTEVQVPYNVTLTGIFYLIGSVGGTDSVVVDLYNNAGTLVASSYSGASGEAKIVGSAANIQKVPFTSTYAAVAGKYYVSLQFNGTTARFRGYTIPGSPFIAATAAGTYRTAASISPGSSFTANKGPISGVY